MGGSAAPLEMRCKSRAPNSLKKLCSWGRSEHGPEMVSLAPVPFPLPAPTRITLYRPSLVSHPPLNVAPLPGEAMLCSPFAMLLTG
jgi:hypothetical protein